MSIMQDLGKSIAGLTRATVGVTDVVASSAEAADIGAGTIKVLAENNNTVVTLRSKGKTAMEIERIEKEYAGYLGA